jgi:hypothetical protein
MYAAGATALHIGWYSSFLFIISNTGDQPMGRRLAKRRDTRDGFAAILQPTHRFRLQQIVSGFHANLEVFQK